MVSEDLKWSRFPPRPMDAEVWLYKSCKVVDIFTLRRVYSIAGSLQRFVLY